MVSSRPVLLGDSLGFPIRFVQSGKLHFQLRRHFRRNPDTVGLAPETPVSASGNQPFAGEFAEHGLRQTVGVLHLETPRTHAVIGICRQA